jgi:uncharacterized membrane protein YhaH (DUF805 family)
MQLVHSLFGFQGRIGRGQWWLAVVIWAVLYFAVVLATMLFASSLDTMLTVGLVLYVLAILLIIPASLKRLHDRNKSGAWIVLFLGCPIATFFLGMLALGGEESPSFVITAIQYVGLAINLWALIELGFLRGSIGNNQYGPDPVAPKPAHH